MEEILRILEDDARTTAEQIATMTGRDVDGCSLSSDFLLPIGSTAAQRVFFRRRSQSFLSVPAGRFMLAAATRLGTLTSSTATTLIPRFWISSWSPMP